MISLTSVWKQTEIQQILDLSRTPEAVGCDVRFGFCVLNTLRYFSVVYHYSQQNIPYYFNTTLNYTINVYMAGTTPV
jgi:hypothetical protein